MSTLVRVCLLSFAAFICDGSIARAPHMNSPGAPCRNVAITLAMENCFDKAYKANDRRLNELYSRILKVLQPEEMQQLKVAQRLWIQFRDTTCTAESDLYKGGTAS